MDNWKSELERIFQPSSNIPVELKKLYSQKNILDFNDDALKLLLQKLRQSNTKYNFEQEISDIVAELQARENSRGQKISRYWAGIGIVLAAIVGLIKGCKG